MTRRTVLAEVRDDLAAAVRMEGVSAFWAPAMLSDPTRVATAMTAALFRTVLGPSVTG